MEPGRYSVEIRYTSWIAPSPDFNFSLGQEIIDEAVEIYECDQITTLMINKNGLLTHSNEHNMSKYDANRPSKVINNYMAWVQYGPESVNILGDNIF